jgi:hypothetical protein
MHTKFCSVKLKGSDHSEDLDVDGRIMLGCVPRERRMGRCGLDSSGSG